MKKVQEKRYSSVTACSFSCLTLNHCLAAFKGGCLQDGKLWTPSVLALHVLQHLFNGSSSNGLPLDVMDHVDPCSSLDAAGTLTVFK